MSQELRIIHVDDDPFELEQVQKALANDSQSDPRFIVESFTEADALLLRLRRQPSPHIILVDIFLGEKSITGKDLVPGIRAACPSAVILMCSSADDASSVRACLAAGADDFVSKRTDSGELGLRLATSYQLAKLKQGIEVAHNLPTHLSAPKNKAAHVGETIQRISARVPLLINSAISAVFIHGESGTGKEVVANLFENALPPNTPFVRINCGAISPTLLESELFGHVKGAFTGAATDKRGHLEAASGGWIFLDEVATLSPSAQVALLRVLENQELLRVGSSKPIAINARVISATNEPIEAMVSKGRFRRDLWQRLCDARIDLPPLRDRLREIPALVEYFCKTMVGGPFRVSTPALDILQQYSWDEGNVRELRNCLRAMTAFQVDKLLTPLAIPEGILKKLNDHDTQILDASKSVAARSAIEPDVSMSPLSPPLQNVEAPKGPGQRTLSIPIPFDQPINFDDLSDKLLLELVRCFAQTSGKQSLRALAKNIGMSRSTLSTRLRIIVQKGIIQVGELSNWVSIGERSE